MSIDLTCPQCGKQIRAPENAGGKHGKCPYCATSVYIPLPPAVDEEEEIGLAPFDEEEERREEELRRESARYAALLDKAAEGQNVGAGEPPSRTRPTQKPGEVIDLGDEVEKFVLAMHESNLEEAEAAVRRLTKAGKRAREYVEGLTLDEMPPEYGSVPPPLAKGFLKALLNRLGK
ncbi:MAG: hypothetical protein J5J06_04845 [Phycisphaerae bacterium]|nr:hypothetical protein [Phycisphaerae bacterium]